MKRRYIIKTMDGFYLSSAGWFTTSWEDALLFDTSANAEDYLLRMSKTDDTKVYVIFVIVEVYVREEDIRRKTN